VDFWPLAAHGPSRRTHVVPAQLRILIKPDLTGFARRLAPRQPTRALVECLIDALHDAGYCPRCRCKRRLIARQIWAENSRGTLALADLTGYRFVTSSGRPYDVLDLSGRPCARTICNLVKSSPARA